MSLLLQTKAITILKPKSPYLLSSTPFCDVSLVIWTTTKEKWAVYVVTSMRGKSRCREVGFQTKTKLPHFILSKQPCRPPQTFFRKIWPRSSYFIQLQGIRHRPTNHLPDQPGRHTDRDGQQGVYILCVCFV